MRHCARFTDGSNGKIMCVIYRIDPQGRLATPALSSATGLTRSQALASAYASVDDETLRQQLIEGVLFQA
jgi:hypothetical protein